MNANFGSCNRSRCVADALGLGSLASGDAAVDPEILRALYRHARGEEGPPVLFVNDQSFARGWLDLEAARPRELVSVLVVLGDGPDVMRAHQHAKSILEAVPWNDVLRIDRPSIQCKVKLHGPRKWGMRFQSSEPAMRGQELVNEQLPPIPDLAQEPGALFPSKPAASGEGDPQEDVSEAADVLRSGGLPI